MQGFNMGRYVPPDVEGTTTSSGNRLHRKHGLGQRASKLASHGMLTVRFEMPFAIWCSSCPQPTIIGQGVRFNAQKSKVGSYYSSPIWSFRFRHGACGGAIEVRTDPKNTAYVVAEGATKRDTGDGAACEAVVTTDLEREALRRSAFASLERTIEDRERSLLASKRIDSLRDAQDRAWEDPYAMNQRLRRTFRVGRKERERDETAASALRDRMGLAIELLPSTEEDVRRAKLVDFAPRRDHGPENALSKPLFRDDASVLPPHRKDDFVSAVVTSTRLARDPFLRRKPPQPSRTKLSGVKRKHRCETTPQAQLDRGPPAKTAQGTNNTTTAATTSTTLVEYDSD